MTIEKQIIECCPECLKTVAELEDEQGELDTLYECGNCGDIFAKSEVEGHKCEQCGKFASKMTDRGCTECKKEVEEDIETWLCKECGTRYNEPGEAYKCCSEALGESKPEPVIEEEQRREAARVAKKKAQDEHMAKMIEEHPPKYQVGDVIKDIDLGSSGSYNRQAFVDAKVIQLKQWGGVRGRNMYGEDLGGVFKWQYILQDINKPDGSTAICDERDIEYQTGRADPSHEYRWCCPYQIVRPGEVCKTCGKAFKDISIEKRV